MKQSGGFLLPLFGPLMKTINSMPNSYKKELKNIDLKNIDPKNVDNLLADTGLSITGKKVKKGISAISVSGITVANNKIKDTIKLIRSLENRGILLKGTTKKVSSQDTGFLNFLRPLMTTDLPLIKDVVTPLAKSALVPLGLTAAAPATDAAIQKKNLWP